eukprot:3338808-Pyramimonas_sp.AAC.1
MTYSTIGSACDQRNTTYSTLPTHCRRKRPRSRRPTRSRPTLPNGALPGRGGTQSGHSGYDAPRRSHTDGRGPLA